jgi:uncharacterized protein YndB with AHSA1/START domain
MNNHFDWSRFVVRINIDAPAQKLYSSWATSEGMETWFLRLCEYTTKGGKLLAHPDSASKGDRYKFLWHGWPDETVEFGEIMEANGTDMFKFSFGKAGHCTVRVLPSGKEQIVELEQDSIPTDEEGKTLYHIGCKTGWTFYLANLKSMMEGGIDLRNRDVSLQNMLNS